MSYKELIGTRKRKLYLKLREEEDNIENELTYYPEKIKDFNANEMIYHHFFMTEVIINFNLNFHYYILEIQL